MAYDWGWASHVGGLQPTPLASEHAQPESGTIGLVNQSEPVSRRAAPADVVRRYFRRLFVERDLSVCDELLAAEYIDHDAPPGTPVGPAATRAYVAHMLQDAPDLTVEPHEVHADAEAVMVRATWRGTRRDGGRVEEAGLR